MGDAFITRRGGGTGKAFAVVGVTYPAGSVCTCSDGVKTLKLKDTSGQGFFLIPYAGTWTVTATDGENERAENVEIIAEGQTERVELMYGYYLYASGIEYVPISLSTTGAGSATKDESYISISTGKSNNASTAVLYATDKIDLTPYSKVCLKYTVTERGVDASSRLAVRSSPTGTIVADTSITADPGDYTVEVDLSAVNQSLYVAVSVGNGGNGTSYFLSVQVHSLWLEQGD